MCLEKYRQSVEENAKRDESFQFLNKSADRAAIVLGTAFKTEPDEILMFSGKLSDDVIGNPQYCYHHFTKFLESGKSFKLLLEKAPEKPGQCLLDVLKAAKESENIEVKIADPEFVELFKGDDDNTPHFAVFNENGYRFEVSPDNFQALVDFFDPERAKSFKKIFTKAFEIGISYQP